MRLLKVYFNAIILQTLLYSPLFSANLQEAVRVVLERNPQIQELTAQHIQAAAAVQIARSSLLPHLTVNTTASALFSSSSQAKITTTEVDAGLALRQTILDYPTFRSFEASRVKLRITEYSILRAKQELAVQVARAYINLWEALVLDSFAHMNLKVASRHAEDTRIRFDAGELTKTDMLWAQSRQELARSKLLSTKQTEIITRNTLRELGYEPNTYIQAPSLHLKPDTLSDSLLVCNRPDIQRYIQEIEVAKVHLSAQYWQYAPTVSGYGQSGYRFGLRTGSTEVGVTMTLPIFTGGQQTATLASRKAAVTLCQSFIMRMKSAAQKEIADNRAALMYAQQSLVLANIRDSIAQKVFDGITEEFKAGTRTIQDAHDAQNELFLAQSACIQEHAALLRAIVQFRLASGTISIHQIED